jgi:trimeric autotransporter adhesin
MKKRQKTFVSSAAALATVAGIIAPTVAFAATLTPAQQDAENFVSYAEKTANFYDFNMAFAKVMALPSAQQPAYLARLSAVEGKAKTADVNAVLTTMDSLAANKDLNNFYKVFDLVNKVTDSKNKQYLQNELNTWGHASVFTPEVVTATDAIIKAWTTKAPADVAAAQVAAAKITNAGSLAWCNDQITQVLAVTPVSTLSVKAINATQLLVTFNKEVNKLSAETPANYQIGTLTAVQIAPVLQADNKSVVITTTTTISGTNLYVVQPITSAADATKKTAIYTNVETYTDTVAPVVSSVTYPTFDKAKVTFSEPITDLGNVVITQNGAPLALSLTTPFVPGSSSITYDLSPVAVLADKPITVVMVGAKDTGNNLMNPNPTTLTLTKSKVDTTAPTVTSINPLSDARVSITFSEKLNAAPTATIGGNAITFDASTDGITWTGSVAAPAPGVQPVAITAFTDMSGNAGTAVTVVKQFTADTTAPTVVSSEVKVFANKPYLVLHFSEDVAPVVGGQTITGTRVKDYVSNTFTTGVNVTPIAYTKLNGADVDDTKAVMLDISSDTVFPVGSYTVSLPASFVQDKALPVNPNAATSLTFTKGTLTVNDTTAPTVNALPTVSADNKYVTVHFSEAMDYASALNVANYKVSGQSIFTSAIFTTDNQTVTLTVAPGSITYSGDRLIQVSGAKDLAGNLNTAYSDIVTFNENVAPYVASAKLVDANTITVTFSENVTATAATDFEVYVGGVKVDPANVSTSISAVPTNTATITLASPAATITDLTKAIQVKLVNPATKDTNGNFATINQLVAVQ